jgi:formate hydrogenlyase transcriptional activator
LESDLFGHEKGAAGAAAENFTRFAGTRVRERLGSSRTHRINVRLVDATHRDVAQMIARNEFRSDLYHRLNVFPVVLPPLRERREDIAQLVSRLVELFARRMGKCIEQIPQTTMNAFAPSSY